MVKDSINPSAEVSHQGNKNIEFEINDFQALLYFPSLRVLVKTSVLSPARRSSVSVSLEWTSKLWIFNKPLAVPVILMLTVTDHTHRAPPLTNVSANKRTTAKNDLERPCKEAKHHEGNLEVFLLGNKIKQNREPDKRKQANTPSFLLSANFRHSTLQFHLFDEDVLWYGKGQSLGLQLRKYLH